MGWLFAAQAFAAAALAFVIEPYVAKLLLPSFGGSAAVWTTAVVFFQVALLAGYAWAHLGIGRLGVRRHALVQLSLAIAALLVLPGALPGWLGGLSSWPETPRLLIALLGIVGFPFFILTSNGPTIQRWFAGTRLAAAREPYRLYAASNAGSLVGLVAYPTLIEPSLDLSQQAGWWAAAFVVFVVLTAAVAVFTRQAAASTSFGPDLPPAAPGADPDASPSSIAPLRRRRIGRWIAWAGVPAALFVGVTAHLSNDVAAVPFLWILPLGTYLVTLIVPFARPAPIGHRAAELLLPAAVVLGVLALAGFLPPWIELQFGVHLLVLLVVGLALHGRLAVDRPVAVELTRYTLAIAAGGALGGLAAGILGPLVLPLPLEEHVALVAAALLAAPGIPVAQRGRYQAPAFGAVVALGLLVTVAGPLLGFGGDAGARPLLIERSFYGAYRVLETAPNRHVLYSGTTIHGTQDLSPGREREPQSYYYRGGPLGQVLGVLLADPRPLRIGAVGLGTGAVAAYGRLGDAITFFEIDETVVRIARDSGLFTFLRDSPANVQVEVVDGRLGLEKAPAGAFDVIVLDAFSSDAVPVHLLTVEALDLAMTRTAAHGVLAFHVSNRYLDLEPVVASAAQTLGLVSITGSHLPPANLTGLADASQWVIVARSYADLAGLAEGVDWATGRVDDRTPWTDRHSDLLSALE